MKRYSINELTRLAFVWAQQDRESLADAWGNGTPERAECMAAAKQLKEYRTKRWGKTLGEQIFEGAKTVSVDSLKP